MTATAPSPANNLTSDDRKVGLLTDLPAHVRIWLYKTTRDLSKAEQNLVRDRGAEFSGTWAAHGTPLDAA